MEFAVVRLGKDSVDDIRRLDRPGTQAPFALNFQCAQVEKEIDVGTYVFIWLGSDNSKGIDTAWKKGVRAIGRIEHLDRGAEFNDTSTLTIGVLSIFDQSLDQFDFLDRSATLYKYFSAYPVIGVRSSRNNAIQRVHESERENTSALLTAIKLLYPKLTDDLKSQAPELLAMLEFTPLPESGTAGDGADITVDEQDERLRAVRKAITERNQLNFLFFGSPGTGKTWHAHRIAAGLTGGQGSRTAFLQFHPSVGYDDFVEGYTPSLAPDQKSIKYEIEPKHFLKLCDAASKDSQHLYVMVVDEISRGDPSRVFGELLTYLEPQYRDRRFSLAYSGNECRIPKNVILIATANPFDRSVGEMDDAFLRRFEMMEFTPDREALSARLQSNGMSAECRGKVLHLFDVINDIVPNGLGHAFFLHLTSEDDAVSLWRSKLSFILRRALQYEADKFAELQQKFDDLFQPAPSGAEPAPAAGEAGASDEGAALAAGAAQAQQGAEAQPDAPVEPQGDEAAQA